MSITTRPGFFSDWSRHSLGVALAKRWSSWQVGGRQLRYDEILAMSPEELKELMGQAIADGQPQVLCWALEARLIQEVGSEGPVWRDLLAVLARLRESEALEFLKSCVVYLSSPLALELSDPYQNYLVGRYYAKQAQDAKGSNKTTMQNSKKTALSYLSKARIRTQQAVERDQSVTFANGKVNPWDLSRDAAASYEEIAYLQWKGTRTTPLPEHTPNE